MIRKLLFLAAVASCASLSAVHGQTASTATPVPMALPPPVPPLPALPAPPLRPTIQPRRDQALINKLTPRVEVWRPNSNHPQILARRSDHGSSDPAFVIGSELVTIRLQFNPQSAGENVTVMAARGIVFNPPQQVLTISPQGDCAFQAQLAEGAPSGHLITYCRNVRTVVPLQRAKSTVVQALEAQAGAQQ